MFAGKYNMTLRVGTADFQDEQDETAHSSNVKGAPFDWKGAGYSQRTIRPKKTLEDMKVIFCREVKDNPSKYGEYGEAMRPITSRLFAVRDYHDYSYISEGKIVQLLSSKVLNQKTEEYCNTFRVVEIQHKPELKEFWLYVDRTQNGIEYF
jgi:hypothetical protein